MVEMREENRVFYEAQKGVSIGSGRWIEGARVDRPANGSAVRYDGGGNAIQIKVGMKPFLCGGK